MISTSLYKQGIKSTYKIQIIFMLVLSMYISIIIAMFDPSMGNALEEFTKSMPEIMALFGMDKMSTELTGFLSSYLYGFLMLIFPMVFTIIIANRLVARLVDKGSMAYLLASPISRKKVAATQAIALFTSQIVLFAFCAILGIIVSVAMFPGELAIKKFLLLNVGAFLLQFAIGGICFFASCISNETKQSLALGAGISTGFYLIHMLSNVGGSIENLKYTTIFSLYNPELLLEGDSFAYTMLLILFLIGLLLNILAIATFSKRDLPL